MNQLQQLQNLFMNAIFDDQKNSPATTELGQYLTHKQQLSAEQQISIYRNSIMSSMTTSLSQIYPVCRRLVEDDFFNFMAHRFIHENFSQSPDLNDYGENFSDFIAEFKPAAELVYLADIARLEWAWHSIFHGPDHTGLNINKLAKLSIEQQAALVFTLPPRSQLICSNFPIHKIWQTNQKNNNSVDTVDLNEGGIKLMIWRQGYEMRIDTLQEDEWQFLSAIQARQPFTDICNQFKERVDVNIQTLLPQCVQYGWIADFASPDN